MNELELQELEDCELSDLHAILWDAESEGDEELIRRIMQILDIRNLIN